MLAAALRGASVALSTVAGKKRVLGVALLLAILIPFAAFNRLPKLDTVREDLTVALAPTAECFQGFCIERETTSSFWTRWWRFSLTYLQLVAIGMAFAFLAGGIAEAFLVAPPSVGDSPASRGRWMRILKGIGMGPVMNLCSACIVPVSTAMRRRGLGVEGALALVHGSATLNVPSLLMIAIVFSPLLGASRLALGLAAAFLIGPLVISVARRSHAEDADQEPACELPVDVVVGGGSASWGQVALEGARDWARATGRLVKQMAPLMVVAGFASGAVIQVLQPDTISAYLGNTLVGVLLAATIGVLINVPLLFEIPLVALLLVLGAGSAPAATLLFAAAAGGPVTFWGMSRVLGGRGIAAYAGGTWFIAAAGGLAVLALTALLPHATQPLRGVGQATPAEAASFEGADSARENPQPQHARPVDAVPLRFIDVSIAAGVAGDVYHSRSAHSLGVNWIDVNKDGRPDLFAVGGDGEFPPRLFINVDGERFEPRHALLPPLPAVEMSGSVFADYDNDGDEDIYVYTDNRSWRLHADNLSDGPPNLLLKNLWMESGSQIPADGVLFDEVAAAAGVDDLAPTPFGELPAYRTKSASWLDFDRDGCVDLYVGHLVLNRESDVANRDRLFRNNCDGTFSDVTDDSGLYDSPRGGYRAALLVLGAHLDDDMWPDLYVVNVSGDNASRSLHTDRVYRNQRGRMVEVFADRPWIGDDAQAGMGIAVADIDLNGTWDIYITDLLDLTPLEDPPFGNVLYLGREGGSLSDNKAVEAGVGGDDSWGVNFIDADHDGWEDIYVSSMLGAANEMLYANNRNGTFTNVAGEAGIETGDGRGSAAADYDGDGDLDIAQVNHSFCADGERPVCSLQLFRNDTASSGGWLQLRLVGTASNRSAIGALVKVQAGPLRLMRQVTGGSSGHSQNSLDLHMGVGEVASIDRVEIQWPSGAVTSWQDQPPNRLVEVVEGRACMAGEMTACSESEPDRGF